MYAIVIDGDFRTMADFKTVQATLSTEFGKIEVARFSNGKWVAVCLDVFYLMSLAA